MNERLHEIIRMLEGRTELQALTPTQIWNIELDAHIATLDLANAAHKTTIALMAGMHLLNDSLDASHSFSQEIEDDATGSYWHGIMHRMEQDYWNSQYWFRRAGNHPVIKLVQGKVTDALKEHAQLNSLPSNRVVNSLKQYRDQRSWNCDEFVDLVKLQMNGQGTEDTRELLEQLQQIELRELFNYTYQAALKAK